MTQEEIYNHVQAKSQIGSEFVPINKLDEQIMFQLGVLSVQYMYNL